MDRNTSWDVGNTGFEEIDDDELPAGFIAITENVYEISFVNPVIEQTISGATTSHVRPLGLLVTR
jgi:hypothetical protein